MNSYLTQELPPSSIPSHLRSLPWTSSLLSSKDYYPIQTFSRIAKPTGEDAFFANTLASESTIPECLTLRRRHLLPPSTEPPTWPSPTAAPSTPPTATPPDVYMLLALADPGISGHPSTAHGGVVATLLDEAMARAVELHSAAATDDNNPCGHLYTAQLDVRYRKPVSVPGFVVVRARVVAMVGRKYWVRAQVLQEEDNAGGHLEWVKKKVVVTDAMAFWLETVQPKL